MEDKVTKFLNRKKDRIHRIYEDLNELSSKGDLIILGKDGAIRTMLCDDFDIRETDTEITIDVY